MMKLSELLDKNANIVKDDSFCILALSNSIVNQQALSFIENIKYVDEVNQNSMITCVICVPEAVEKLHSRITGIVISNTPRLDFFKLHNELSTKDYYKRSDFNTKIGEECKISPLAYIDYQNVQIGSHVKIEEFVSIRGHCKIGNNCTIHSGTSIGGEGYEFKIMENNILPVNHAGGVIIGNNVEIWSQCTIHKAVYPWDNTLIGDMVRMNSQTHVDHGAKIGKQVKLCAGSIVSGRVVIDDNAYIGPGSVISNRIHIGKYAKLSIGSVATKNANDFEVVTGNFAIPHNKFMKNLKVICHDDEKV